MLSVVLDTYYGVERHVWAWGIGTAFALAAILISIALLVATWRHNHYPPLRLYITLVLLMVPVYSIFAWLGLVLKNQSQYWYHQHCTHTFTHAATWPHTVDDPLQYK